MKKATLIYFDEEDIFRLTVPLNTKYSPEKGIRITTLQTTQKLN